MENTNNYLTLSAEEFAEWVLENLKYGDSVTFALNRVSKDEVENWWFIKIINIPEGDSVIAVIDYCGGGLPEAIPLGDFPLCQQDKEFFIQAVAHYFRKNNDFYNDDEKITIDLNDISRRIQPEMSRIIRMEENKNV